jgi:hypothetical protein
MTGPNPVTARQNPVWAVFQQPAKWAAPVVPYVKELETVKNLAQSYLAGIWALQGLPRLVQLLRADALLPYLSWTAALKPFEKFGSTVKEVGTFLELPHRILALSKVKGEWQGNPDERNRWKAANRIVSVAYVALDALVLIPYKWNLWNLLLIGDWAARVGVTAPGLTAVKDGLTAFAAALNVRAEGINRDKALAKITKYKARNEASKPLMQLAACLGKDQTFNSEAFQKIEELRVACRTKTLDEKMAIKEKRQAEIATLEQKRDEKLIKLNGLREGKIAKMIKIAEQSAKVQKIEQEIHLKREKIERIGIWSEPAPITTQDQVDRLRQAVIYKVNKNEVRAANARMDFEKARITRYFDISKCAVIIFSLMLTWGVATVAAPYLGLSVATVGSIFFLGQWITGISTGLCGLCKTYKLLQYSDDKRFKPPQTHLVRV